MRTALKISIGLNLLLACLCLILAQGWKRNGAEKQAVASPAASTASPPTAEPKPFRWSQLESTNYLAYIANLRQIDCPEQTVRDIVTADVESLYRARAERLRQQSQSRPSLDAALQQLAAEKISVIGRLLGVEANINSPADSIASAPQKESSNAAITTPLVWQNVDVSNLNLEEGQMQAIAALRQNFLDKIGGENQDPNDPTYRECWQKAQPEIDDALAGMIGRKAFLQYGVLASPSDNPPASH